MKTIFQIYLLLALLSLTVITSCGRKGFEASQFSATNGENGNNNQNGQNPPGSHEELAEQINNLDMRTYAPDSPFGSSDPTKGDPPFVDLDKTGTGQFIIRLPLGVSSVFSVGTSGTHQKYKDITFSIEGTLTTGYRLVIKIPLKYILRLNQFESTAPGRLPNGDPLPHTLSGELPRLDISINPAKKEKIYLYLSKSTVGILFESKFDPLTSFSCKLTDKNQLNDAGFFDVIPAKNNAPAAFLVLFQLSETVSTLLDKYFLN